MGRRPGGLALWAATCSTRRAANGRCSSHSLTLWLLLTLTLSLSHSHSAVRASELCCSTPLSLGGRPLPDSTRAQGGSRGLPGPPRQPRPAALSRSPGWGCPRGPRRVLRPRAAQFLTATGASGPPGPRGSPGVFAWACRPRGLRGSPASASCSFPLRHSPLAFLTPFCFFLYSCESYAFCLSSFKGYPRISACMFTGVSGQRRGGSQARAALPPTLPASQGHVPFRGSRKRRPWTSRCVGARGSSREPLLATRPSCATCFSGATFPENVLFPVSPERECRWADKST